MSRVEALVEMEKLKYVCNHTNATRTAAAAAVAALLSPICRVRGEKLW